MKKSYLNLVLALFCLVAISSQAQKQQPRITVKGTQFFKGDKPYSYIGTNYWYGSLLASKKVGDRKRLLRELDLMQKKRYRQFAYFGGRRWRNIRLYRSSGVAIRTRKIRSRFTRRFRFFDGRNGRT